MAIKRTALDKVVSDLVRARVDWICERCEKYFPEGSGRAGLHCSHFYGRGSKSVRYFFSNLSSFCYGCHKYMERSRDEYTAFKKKELGETAFDELVRRANAPRKYTKADIKDMTKHYKAQLKYIERRRANGEQGYLPVVDWE